MRFIVAVLLAPIFYGVVLLPGNQLLMLGFPAVAERTAPPTTVYLVLALLLSLGYAAFAGFCSAWVAREGSLRLGLWAGGALLAVGAVVQVSIWGQLPVWYHLAFLVTIVPFTILGAGGYRSGRDTTASEP